MLTVEFDDVGQEIAICFDRTGLQTLRRALDRLENLADPNHAHLMTASWGGSELDETPVGQGTRLISHLRLVRLPDVE